MILGRRGGDECKQQKDGDECGVMGGAVYAQGG